MLSDAASPPRAVLSITPPALSPFTAAYLPATFIALVNIVLLLAMPPRVIDAEGIRPALSAPIIFSRSKADAAHRAHQLMLIPRRWVPFGRVLLARKIHLVLHVPLSRDTRLTFPVLLHFAAHRARINGWNRYPLVRPTRVPLQARPAQGPQ